jgi:DNA-binding transcriptional LysR family regulator
MTIEDLRVFAMVAAERSFSRAAKKLRRTQPAVSQAIRRLEETTGERLIDRSSRDGTLTDAGHLLLTYAQRILRLLEEAAVGVGELRDIQKGRVVIGSNEAGVHALLPLLETFRKLHPGVLVDVRRVHSRQIAHEVLLRAVDFGVLTFQPPEKELQSVPLWTDELVLLVKPDDPLAKRKQITMEEMGRQTIIAHNDPSPARDRVLQLYEQRHAALNIRLSLPSLDSIKRAVEMGLGVALLPRRCALSEISRGQLAAVLVPELRSPRQVRFVFRKDAELSHAAKAFLETVRNSVTENGAARSRVTA